MTQTLLDVRTREAALAHYRGDLSTHGARVFVVGDTRMDSLTFASYLRTHLVLNLSVMTVHRAVNLFLRERFPLKREYTRRFFGRNDANTATKPKAVLEPVGAAA